MDCNSASGADACFQETIDALDQALLTSQVHINATCVPEDFAHIGKLPANLVEDSGADICKDR